ncbi:MAG: hypothetical protein IKY13_02110 [Bacteroidaceae bacterium]|nr:hypothetical protein [Bacteroidaceae bacterium]
MLNSAISGYFVAQTENRAGNNARQWVFIAIDTVGIDTATCHHITTHPHTIRYEDAPL